MMFDHLLVDIYRVSAVYSTEFDLVDVLQKFIKGFGLLFFGRTQHIGFFVDFWLVVYCVTAELCCVLPKNNKPSLSTEFDLVDVLKKFIKGFRLLFFGRTQHFVIIWWSSIYWFFGNF